MVDFTIIGKLTVFWKGAYITYKVPISYIGTFSKNLLTKFDKIICPCFQEGICTPCNLFWSLLFCKIIVHSSLKKRNKSLPNWLKMKPIYQFWQVTLPKKVKSNTDYISSRIHLRIKAMIFHSGDRHSATEPQRVVSCESSDNCDYLSLTQ